MLKTVDYGVPYARPVVLCLGRYESLHLGHAAIIESALALAKESGAEVMLMTYDERNNPRFGRVILTFEERLDRAEQLGVSSVMRVNFNEVFMSLTAEEFLQTVSSALKICGVACGFDFRFGKGRMGDVELLKEYFGGLNVPVLVTDKLALDGEKISSTAIRKYLEDGNIIKANEMLGYRYFISGTVVEGRKQGRQLGFPTANVRIAFDKALVKNGVYLTRSTLNSGEYKGITNVGTAPTFGFSGELMETHYDGYSDELYGESIKVEFTAFLREIRKFSSAEELSQQLGSDLARLRKEV